MFYDERIEAQSGRIFRKGILIATILAAVFTVFKALGYERFQFRDVFSFFTEAAIIMTGVIILLIGELFRERPEVKDERYYAEKYAYYNKAAKVFLYCGMAGFAGSLFVGPSDPGQLSSGVLILFLELLGFVYIASEFKKNGINLNYSVIDLSNREYYASVFRGIGKMAMLLAALYSLPVLYRLTGGNLSSALAAAVACVDSILSLGAIWLIISWIEKVSRNEEEKAGKTYKCLVISFAFVLGLNLLQAVFQILSLSLNAAGQLPGIPLGQIAALNSYVNRYSDYYFNAFLGLSLAAAIGYAAERPRRIIGYLIGYVYAHIVNDFLRTILFPFICILDNRFQSGDLLAVQFARISSVIQYALLAIYSLLLILLFCSLIKTYGYHKWILVLQSMIVALQIVCYALRVDDQLANGIAILSGGFVQSLLLAGVMITLKGHRKAQ